MSKTGSADELNRGYFDDMSELKQHGGKPGSFMPWMLYILMVKNQSYRLFFMLASWLSLKHL